MHLAFCGQTALHLTRAVRSGLAGRLSLESHEPLRSPDPGSGRRRFTTKLLTNVLLGGTFPLPLDQPLEVAAPRRASRPQAKLFKSTVYGSRIPNDAFVSLGDGFQVSSPELLFIEMASVMPLFNLVLLGCELCGTYSRNPDDPLDGEVVFGVQPATNVQAMQAFAQRCSHLPSSRRACEAMHYVMDNAWSPMEAVVATLAVLPPEHFGYGLGPVVLNKRVGVSAAASHTTRLPDMMLGGTMTGLNYDGENHLDLDSVVNSVVRLMLDPGSEHLSGELTKSARAVREKYVDDRRRDRELWASGRAVFVVTYEDLVERGGLDRVMALVMDSMEQRDGVDLSWQRAALAPEFLRRKRQELVWSALPGELGRKTRRRLAASRRQGRASQRVYEYSIKVNTNR